MRFRKMANSTVSSEKEAAQWDLERPIRFLIWHQGCREDRVASSVPPCTLLLVPFSAEGLWSASGVRIPLCPPSAVILALGFSRKAFSNCLNDPNYPGGEAQQLTAAPGPLPALLKSTNEIDLLSTAVTLHAHSRAYSSFLSSFLRM